MMNRHTIGLLMLLSLGTTPAAVWAEAHSITATGEYKMGENDSLEDAKRLALLNARTLVVGQAVQYLVDLPDVKQLGLNADELRAYTTGLLEINEYPHETATQGPQTTVSVLVKTVIDPSIVVPQLEQLMRNERAKVELTRARDKIDGYRKDLDAATQRLAAAHERSELQTIAQHRRDLMSFIDTEEQMAHTWSALVGAEEMRRPDTAPGKEASKHKKSQSKPAHAGAPDNAEEHRKKGASLNAQGNYDAAIPEFRQALSLMPDLTRAHLGLGEALQGKGDLQGAMAEYKTALSKQPDDPDAHTALGTLLQGKGDLEGAIAEYRTSLRQRPDDALTHFNLGTALAAKGQVEEAVTEYRTAIRLNPDLVEAYFDLGSLLKANAQTKEAADAFREYVKRAPDTPANKKWIEQAQAFLTETGEQRRHERH
jgi:tetratricopeptide (TPR) repeat protein